MNVFNRIIMVILMLCIIVFSIVAIVNIFANLFEWPGIFNRVINSASRLNPFVLALILFLILSVALVILIFEFYKRKVKHASIYADASGKTMMTLKTTTAQIKESLNNLQDIIEPQIKVVPKQNGIIIDIFSKLVTGVNVADKTKEIRETASSFASNNLGFKVLQANYTVTGFAAKKVKETVKETSELDKKEEQAENKIE